MYINHGIANHYHGFLGMKVKTINEMGRFVLSK